MTELCVRNRQRVRAVHAPLLRRIARALIEHRQPAAEYQIGVYLVAASAMTRLNKRFLRHEGSTDVITFHYSTPDQAGPLIGEIFICVDEAVRQARRFRTTWPAEIVRYLIHGLLHLEGYDDLAEPDRRNMKREENRVLRELGRRFPLSALARKPRLKQ
jgi:probable rRNA maturation factor